MAVNTQEFKIKISVEDGVTTPLKSVAASAQDQLSVFAKLGVSTVFLNQALELSKTVYESLMGPLKEAVDAYVEQDKAINKLSASLKLVGQDTQAHIQVFEDFAAQMQDVANVADDVTLNLASMAKASGFSDAQTKLLIQTSADLAAVTDKDVNAAFRELMGQFSGAPGRIAKLIPELANFTEGQLRAGKGVEYLSERLRGFAAQDALSLDGALKRMSLASDDFFKELGKAIVQATGFGNILDNKTKSIKNFTAAVKEMTPNIVAVGEAFRAIDWTKIATGILAVAAAIAVLKATQLSFWVIQAISAIGGLSAAVAAMGGMAGIIAQTAAWFQALSVSAGAALTPLLGYAAIVAGVLALGAAIEIIVRNFSHLEDVVEVVWQSFRFMFAFLQEQFTKASILVEELALRFYKFITASSPVKLNAQIENTTKNIEALNKSLLSAESLGGDALTKLNASAAKVDFGAAGEAVKFVNGLLDSTNDKTKEAGKAAKDYADKTRGPIPNLQEQLKLYAEIADANATLSNEIINIGATTTDQIKNNLNLDLQRLAVKRQQLELEGKLVGEQGELIKKQIEQTEILMRAKAGKQIDAAENPNAVSPDNLKAISSAMGEGAGQVASTIGSAVGSISGAMTGVGAVMGAVNGVLDFVQQVIDFIPQVLNKVAGIFDSLTDLPNKLVSSIDKLLDSIINFVTNFIPNLLKSIPKILNSIITFLFEGLPNALMALMEAVPDIIMDILNQLPDLIQRLVQGLITNAPRILIMTLEFFVKNAPKIAIALMRTFYIEIPKAIINGIIEGGKQLVAMIGAAFSGKSFKVPAAITDIPKQLEKAANDFGKKVSKESSQLFQVKNLSDAFQGPGTTTLATSATNAATEIEKKFKNLWQYLKDAWQWVWDKIIAPIGELLKKAWTWVYDKIITPIIEAIQFVWQTIYDNILEPFIKALDYVWNWVNDHVLRPFISGVQYAWQWIYNNVMMPFINAIYGAWNWVLNNIVTPLRTGISAAWQWVYDNVVKPLQAVGEVFKNFRFPSLPSFSWPALPSWSWPEIKFSWPELPTLKVDMPGGGGGGNGNILTNGTLDPTTWARGGMIPQIPHLTMAAQRGVQYAARGLLMQPRGSDTIPAMVAPGEFIVSARPAQQNLSTLKAINSGNPVSTGVTIQNINVTTSSKADEDMVRREFIPAVERSLKRKSQNGEFVIDKNGVR